MVKINFAYLKDSLLKSEYSPAEKLVQLYELAYYREVVANSRLLLEEVVAQIFEWENLDKYYPVHNGNQRTLRSDTFYLQAELDYPTSIIDLFNEVRRFGNNAVHDPNYQFSKGQAWRVICDINDVFVFLLNSYAQQRLYYLRPDIGMDATLNKGNAYHHRQVKGSKVSEAQPSFNHDVQMERGHAFLQKKKKHHLGSHLRKFLRRK